MSIPLEQERDKCLYFSTSRDKAYAWEHGNDITNNQQAFADECAKCSVVFLRAPQWSDIINSKLLVDLMEPSPSTSEVMKGNLGHMAGCSMYTDAFCHPEVKDGATPAIIFVPRE